MCPIIPFIVRFVLLISLYLPGYSQQFGFSVNTTRSYLTHPGEQYNDVTTQNNPSFCFGGGVDARFKLKQRLYLTTGINFSNFVYSQTRNYNSATISGWFSLIEGFTFYHIPLVAEYTVYQAKKLNFFVEGGFKSGVITHTLIGYKYSVRFQNTFTYTDSTAFSNAINFYPVLSLGGGTGYFFKNNRRIQITASYDISFLKVPEVETKANVIGVPFNGKFSPRMNYLVFKLQFFPFGRKEKSSSPH